MGIRLVDGSRYIKEKVIKFKPQLNLIMNEYEEYKKWEYENTFIKIYTYDELNKYIDSNRCINVPLEIRGLHINKLKGVKRITKHLTLGDTGFEDLGDLEIIEGNFTIWNIENQIKIKSLTNLKVVNGDVNLRYTKLNSLGSLTEIGGNLNLRDTNITDLSSILKVRGNIHLPKKFKTIIEYKHIQLGGKVKYWNDTKQLKNIPLINIELIKSEVEIPHWEFQYITSYQQIQSEENSIQEFYEYFKKSFFKEVYLDISGETNYLFTLLLEVRDTLINDEDYIIKKKYFKILSECYPILRHYTTEWIIGWVEKNGEYEYLKELVFNQFHENFNDYNLKHYFYLLNKTNDYKLNPDLIWRITSNSSLTKYGIDNLNEVKKYFDIRVSFSHNSDIITEFMRYTEKWDSYGSITFDENVGKEIKKVVSFFERELRESENDLRVFRELPKIGEGWISETELYYLIKEKFNNHLVLHHGKPKWLGRQHLDIYLPDLNVGIEYQGKQHTSPVDFFGGEGSFEENKKKRL
jgi:hypothetical protein